MKPNEPGSRSHLRRIYWTGASLVVVVLVLLGSVFFLNPSSVGNRRFAANINLWAVFWAANFVLILVLSFILARNLIKLFFEYQDNRPGSRIKTKLVITLITFSLFPALVMAFLAFGLINANLRQWFSSPSEQLLESSRQIAKTYYQQLRLYRLASAHALAREVVRPEALQQAQDLGRQYGFESVEILDAQGRPRLHSSAGEQLEARAMALKGRLYYRVRRENTSDRGVVALPLKTPQGHPAGALVATFSVPESVTFHALRVEEASRAYQDIKEDQNRLQLNYFLVLGLTTLAVIFAFVWLATYIARRITIPLEALAEGSRRLAEGDLEHTVDVEAVDELAVMIDSFNRMAREIRQSRQQLERANQELRDKNQELDERRRYTETVLQNIATGVISIDESNVIRTVNQAALKMLEVRRGEILNRSIREVSDPQLYGDFLTLKKRARLYGNYRKEISIRRGDRELHVAATITSNPLPFQDEPEYLIVLDDLTELIKAEKFAAWQEVARRLAHEIKNPLTPIQLSAERVRKRFERLAGSHGMEREMADYGEVVEEATRIIVSEAQMLRSLVEEFSRFARLPICKPRNVMLHRLIDEALAMYDGGLEHVRIERRFDPELGEVEVDPEQMQRVFSNLIDNSLDALAEISEERRIAIRTRLNRARRAVTIEFEDNGKGIPAKDYENLFLPYFSTKKKGTGLGLAIVRQIVSEHSGFIRAEPNLPRGTRFRIELPLA